MISMLNYQLNEDNFDEDIYNLIWKIVKYPNATITQCSSAKDWNLYKIMTELELLFSF